MQTAVSNGSSQHLTRRLLIGRSTWVSVRPCRFHKCLATVEGSESASVRLPLPPASGEEVVCTAIPREDADAQSALDVVQAYASIVGVGWPRLGRPLCRNRGPAQDSLAAKNWVVVHVAA